MTDAAQQPSPPKIDSRDLLKQFWADVFGKEVQDATTYSYTWLADQVGHVCLGLMANFVATIIAKLVFGLSGLAAELTGMSVAIAGACCWEWLAHGKSVRKATGLFPLGKKLLRDNAIIASVYMTLGAIAGFLAIRVALAMAAPEAHETPWWGFVGLLILLVVGISLAPAWLRQKIIWQKAALPYLSRLAETPKKTLEDNMDADLLQELISRRDRPPAGCQVIITGPIGSGRTSFAAAIGTELAFTPAKVRYLSFGTLLELATGSSPPKYINYAGPLNIKYWPWNEAQVVVIDNIGPVANNLGQFGDYLDDKERLKAVADVFHKCHSVWVLGDVESVDGFSDRIRDYCGAKEEPLIVEMSAEGSKIESGQVIHRATIWRKGEPSRKSTIEATSEQRTQ